MVVHGERAVPGHARCWDVCPEKLSLDDQGHAFLIAEVVPVELLVKVEVANGSRPERAIEFG